MPQGNADEPREFGAWNPGIRSQVPRDLLHLATIFRAENVFTRVADAEELRDLTGIELADLVTFRPQRLALHELLVRVTADLSVPDGSAIGDLGINFRRITRALLAGYVEPQMTAIVATYDALRQGIAAEGSAWAMMDRWSMPRSPARCSSPRPLSTIRTSLEP